jgi:hypothetical protein
MLALPPLHKRSFVQWLNSIEPKINGFLEAILTAAHLRSFSLPVAVDREVVAPQSGSSMLVISPVIGRTRECCWPAPSCQNNLRTAGQTSESTTSALDCSADKQRMASKVVDFPVPRPPTMKLRFLLTESPAGQESRLPCAIPVHRAPRTESYPQS